MALRGEVRAARLSPDFWNEDNNKVQELFSFLFGFQLNSLTSQYVQLIQISFFFSFPVSMRPFPDGNSISVPWLADMWTVSTSPGEQGHGCCKAMGEAQRP